VIQIFQALHATRVAGFNTWKSLGRFVKKGQTGIRILAPIIRKVDEEKIGTIERVSRPFGFRTVAVFDYAQTEGEPLPELNTNATEGGEAFLPLLEKAAAQLNITLVYKAIEGRADGLSKGGLIEIEETLDTPARCGVIAHELAHLCCVTNYVAFGAGRVDTGMHTRLEHNIRGVGEECSAESGDRFCAANAKPIQGPASTDDDRDKNQECKNPARARFCHRDSEGILYRAKMQRQPY
jgi:hypothetical protein